MIGYLRGRLAVKTPPHVALEVAGIGYELDMPLLSAARLPEVGSEVVLVTHHLVREDGIFLYGFLDEEERVLFRHLLRVSGVGPRVALAILSTFPVGDFVSIIHREDPTLLVRVPGVGKKTAERLVLELRDRLRDWYPGGPGVPPPVSAREEALTGLLALGYRREEAERLLARLEGDFSSTELIRAALKLSLGQVP